MKSDPLISITIPCYNYARYVGEAIRSVLEQTYSNLQLIVVDNASTDSSLEVIRSFSDPRLEVLSIEKNAGMIPAWRLGFERSRGDWLAVLPADDFFLKNKLAEQVAFIREHPETDVLGTYIIAAKADSTFYEDEEVFLVRNNNQPFDFDDFENWEWNHKLWMPTVLYRREFCDEVDHLAIGQYNVFDWEFHIRLLRRKTRFAVLPKQLTCYRWHGENQSNPHHTGLAPILLEWVYSHARAYAPLMKELGRTAPRSRDISKFFNQFLINEQPVAYCAKFLAALLDPEETLRRCPTFSDFKAISGDDLLAMPRMPEFMGMAESLATRAAEQQKILKHAIASASEHHIHEAEKFKTEMERLGEESNRRAAERDRARLKLEKLRSEVKKLRDRLANREKEKASSRPWFRKLRRK